VNSKSGIIALPGLLDVTESVLDFCAVIEVEPQTFWRQKNQVDGFEVDEVALKRIASWGKPVTLHGVGTPIGGTVFNLDAQAEPLLRSCEILNPEWFSEHLAFNRSPDNHDFTGFFLPPLQCEEMIEIAAGNLQKLSKTLGLPVLFETGVNYLPYDQEQMTDGLFYATLAEYANCGILLDLHNVWCNERNGRSSIVEVCAELDWKHVREVHLASGNIEDGIYLDSHDNIPSQKLLDLFTKHVLPNANNLKWVVFEITATNYIANNISTRDLRSFLQHLGRLTKTDQPSDINRERNFSRPEKTLSNKLSNKSKSITPPLITQKCVKWEQDLLATLYKPSGDMAGISMYRKLIDVNRLGELAATLTLSVRVSARLLGAQHTKENFINYLDKSSPALSSEAEAKQFQNYLMTQDNTPQWMKDSLTIDMGRIEVSTTLKPTTVVVSTNPEELFSLAKGNDVQLHLHQAHTYRLTMSP